MAGPRKILVAVHGIGDQAVYETIQSVLNRVCGYLPRPGGIPLGAFHLPVGSPSVYMPPAPQNAPPAAQNVPPAVEIGFAEVHWADITRKPEEEGFILEEPRKWARTVVERVRALYGTTPAGREKTEADWLADVIDEMIEAVRVLERLTFLAEKAGVLEFNLGKVLTHYLGDVQAVADFADLRRDVLRRFLEMMHYIGAQHSGDEVYIIAHSEGSVVAFLGLLMAMSHARHLPPLTPKSAQDEDVPSWVSQVRGFMTIGSPIDKHLILWPELFADVATPPSPAPAATIKWHNYSDYGDPVGSQLDTTRNWLTQNGWSAFDFPPGNDFQFRRYFLPGQAHVDYWNDEYVFGHFLQNVVGIAQQPPGSSYSAPPPNRFWARWTSYVLPYVVPAVLLFLGVYLLYKGTAESLGAEPEVLVVFRDVTAISLVLSGMTFVGAMFRLTQLSFWRVLGIVWFLASLVLYPWISKSVLLPGVGVSGAVRGTVAGADAVRAQLVNLPSIFDSDLIPLVALIAGIVVTAVSWGFPSWRLRPLLAGGGLMVLATVAYHLAAGPPETGESASLWPVFLGGAAFLYLWWLAALLFDLVFVWHRYIRWAIGLQKMRGLWGTEKAQQQRAEMREQRRA
jgi:hypothetical protein